MSVCERFTWHWQLSWLLHLFMNRLFILDKTCVQHPQFVFETLTILIPVIISAEYPSCGSAGNVDSSSCFRESSAQQRSFPNSLYPVRTLTSRHRSGERASPAIRARPTYPRNTM